MGSSVGTLTPNQEWTDDDSSDNENQSTESIDKDNAVEGDSEIDVRMNPFPEDVAGDDGKAEEFLNHDGSIQPEVELSKIAAHLESMAGKAMALENALQVMTKKDEADDEGANGDGDSDSIDSSQSTQHEGLCVDLYKDTSLLQEMVTQLVGTMTSTILTPTILTPAILTPTPISTVAAMTQTVQEAVNQEEDPEQCSNELPSKDDASIDESQCIGSFHVAMSSYLGPDYKKTLGKKSFKRASRSWKNMSKLEKTNCIKKYCGAISKAHLNLNADGPSRVKDKILFRTLKETRANFKDQTRNPSFTPNIDIPEEMDFQRLIVEHKATSENSKASDNKESDQIVNATPNKPESICPGSNKRRSSPVEADPDKNDLNYETKQNQMNILRESDSSRSKGQNKKLTVVQVSEVGVKDSKSRHEIYDLTAQEDPLENSIHGLTKSLWHRIFDYLNLEDLKSVRMVSRKGCNLVETSLPWAINVCFLLNGNSNNLKAMKTCPSELICEDNTLGWPFVRLKYVTTPFEVEIFFANLQLRESIRFLEIKNCRLSWIDVLNLVCCLSNMEELSYIVTPDFIRQYDVFTNLVGNLDETYSISSKIKHLKDYNESKKSKSIYRAGSSPTRLKKVVLDALNLEITNIILAVLEQTCNCCIQELHILFSTEFLLTLSRCNTHILHGPKKKIIRARRLIENNQITLKVLQISFLEQLAHRNEQECIDLLSGCMPTFPIFYRLFTPGYKKLSLNQLIIEMPHSVPIPSRASAGSMLGTWDGVYPNCETECQVSVIDFCLSQKKLQRLKFSQIDLTAESETMIHRLKQIASVIPSCKVEIGATYYCGDMETTVPTWKNVEEVLVDIKLGYVGKKPLPYSRIISHEMPVMSNVQKLDFRSEVKRLVSFNIPIITKKFPNLTSLRLGDIRIRQQDGIENATTIKDEDFQLIINHLPHLTDLAIKGNMTQLTDFGLTGISYNACARMLNENCFKRKAGDVVGSPLSNLKRLEILELHGFGESITNVSAYLAFKDLACLQELYLFTPTFSRLARKFLKDKFRLRCGFRMSI